MDMNNPPTVAPSYDGPETVPNFVPLKLSIDDIRQRIPQRLFQRNTLLGIAYLCRDLAMAAMLFYGACYIDNFGTASSVLGLGHVNGLVVLRWTLWVVYWWFQGLVFTGLWVIGHECGHGAFSGQRITCNIIGYIVHTALWTPYFSWKISHHRHHSSHASMERDEVYVPWTRAELNLPEDGGTIDFEDYFSDTPLYTLCMLIGQQLFAFPAYLLYNVSGQRSYPKGTNHFDPRSIIFSESQRSAVLASNVGVAVMVALTYFASARWGMVAVIKYYGIPWLCVNHWFVMITFLHHTDPDLPHYRAGEWTFARGAAATVDRDFLGWMGSFFLHGVAHFHVVHHFFPKLPFYNGPEATEYLKAILGDHYHCSRTPVFKALWHNYNECQFVDNTGDILFYRNKQGRFAKGPEANVCGQVE